MLLAKTLLIKKYIYNEPFERIDSLKWFWIQKLVQSNAVNVKLHEFASELERFHRIIWSKLNASKMKVNNSVLKRFLSYNINLSHAFCLLLIIDRFNILSLPTQQLWPMMCACVIKETPFNKRALLLVHHLRGLTSIFPEFGGSIWL